MTPRRTGDEGPDLQAELVEKEKRIRKLEQNLRDHDMKFRQLDSRLKRLESRAITRKR